MEKTPTSVKVLGVIGIIFAVLGFVSVLGSIPMFLPGQAGGPPNPLLEAYKKDTVYMTVTAISLLVSLPLSILLMAGSVGSLTLKPWARKCMLIYAGVNIVHNIAVLIFNFVYVIPLTEASLPQGNHPTDIAVREAASMTGVLTVIFTVIGMIYPVCVLWFYTRPHVVDAFQGIFPERADYRSRRDRDRDKWDDDDNDDEEWDDRDKPDDRFTARPK